jgi:hypothetical protein
MPHDKRKRPKNSRAGCLLCKPHKMNGLMKRLRLKGLRVPRLLTAADEGHMNEIATGARGDLCRGAF